MFKTRKYNKNTGKVELWAYDWDRRNGRTQKRYLNKIEDDIDSGYASGDDLQPGSAVCWSFEGTMGNIAVNSAAILGRFDADSGTDAVLPCEIIKAGKFRHGAPRWYCRTHMVYWGTNADIEAQNSRSDEEGEIVCSNSTLKFSYVKNPLTIDLNEFSEVGIWCSLPPALSSRKIEKRDAKIHFMLDVQKVVKN